MDKRRIKTIEIRLKSHAEKPKKQVAARVIPSHKGKLLCIVALAVACSACSGSFGQVTANGHGRLLVEGDKEVVAEIWKGMNGLVVTGKAKPNGKDAYFSNQNLETDLKKYEFVTIDENQGS